jgi:CHASE2 domain-containing sensor protein
MNFHSRAGALARRIILAVLASIALGAAIYAAAWYARDFTFVGDVAEQSKDVALALRADIEPPRHLQSALIFVAIDEDAYAALGRKSVVPADAIEKILETIADAQPALIVMDIDLSARGEPKDVAILSRALSLVQKRSVPLFLVRSTPRRSSDQESVYLSRTPYDVLLHGSKAQWVSGEALVSQGITRGVSSWVLTCTEGRPEVLFGVGPMASAIYYGDASPTPDSLFPKPDWNCSNRSATLSATHYVVPVPSFGGAHRHLTNKQDRLIHYSLRWNGTDWSSSQMVVRKDGSKRPLMSVMPAGRILTAGTRAIDETGDLFKGAIVVVGASHVAAGDLQNTPIGEMPGAMVLVNHIRGVLDFGPEGPEHFLPGLFIMLGMSALTGLFVATLSRWTSSWGGLVLPILFTLLWWGASALLLGGTGYFALSLSQLFVGVATALLYPRKNETL